MTSNTPPEEGIKRNAEISLSFALRISSATRTAWGRYPQLVQYSIETSILPAIDKSTSRSGFPWYNSYHYLTYSILLYHGIPPCGGSPKPGAVLGPPRDHLGPAL